MSSSIGPSLPASYLRTDATSTPNAPGASTSTTGGTSTALYQTFGATAFPTGPFGTRTPQNAEDAAIILAQAALAVDQANDQARDNRLAAAGGSARSALSAAVNGALAAQASLAQAQVQEAGYRAQLADDQQKIGALNSKIAGYDTQIATLNAQIKVAELAGDSAAVRSLTSSRDKVQSDRNDAADQRDALQTDADAVSLKADAAHADVVRFTSAVQATSFAAIAAFSLVVQALQDKGGARAQEDARSTQIDHRLDEVGDLLKSFQKNEVDRAEAESQRTQDLRDRDASNRVQALALGLVAGLAEVLQALSQIETSPALNTREAAITAGQRFQLPFNLA